jgi:hypothetical protein
MRTTAVGVSRLFSDLRLSISIVTHSVLFRYFVVITRNVVVGTTAILQPPPKHQKLQHANPKEQLTQIPVKVNLFKVTSPNTTSQVTEHRLIQYRCDIIPSKRQKSVDDEGNTIWETVPVATQGEEMMDDTQPRAAQEGNPVAPRQEGPTTMESTPLTRRIIEALKNTPHNLNVISDGAGMLYSGTALGNNPSSLYDFDVQVKASCGM